MSGYRFKLPYSSENFGTTSSPLETISIGRYRFSDNSFFANAREYINRTTHTRGGKSSNRRRPLPGSSTYWIPPSNYSRSEYVVQYVGTGPYRTSDSTYYYNGVLGASMLKYGFTVRRTSLPDWVSGPSNSPPISSSFLLQNAVNTAITKARNDLGSAKANLGEALATARQTADLVVDTTIKLLRFVLAVKRGDLRRVLDSVDDLTPAQFRRLVNAGKIPRKAADKWLAFHYGWRPLAQDVHGAVELFQGLLSSNPSLLVHGRGAAEVASKDKFFSPWDLGNPQLDISYDALFQVRVNLTGRVQEAGIARAINQAGLINPAALAWELIPFSFVVDWFVPIGGVLNALSATSGLTFVGGHKTEAWHELWDGVPTGASVMSPSSIPKVKYYKSGFTRSAYGSFPLPAPYLKPFYTGGDRWATIASLLTSFGSNWGRRGGS